MKKIIITLIVIMVALVCVKFIPFGTKNKMMGASLVNIEVPKLSILSEECCSYSATFKTIRSKSAIKKELNKMIKKYQTNSCGTYYDFKNNVTITDYGVKGGILLNTFYINYEKGNTCQNNKDEYDKFYEDTTLKNIKDITSITLDEAINNNYFVVNDSKTYNDTVYNSFMSNYNVGISSFIRVVNFDDNVTIDDIKYTGSNVIVVHKTLGDDTTLSMNTFEKAGIFDNGYNQVFVVYNGELAKNNYTSIAIIN